MGKDLPGPDTPEMHALIKAVAEGPRRDNSAYHKAIAANPKRADAPINLGRLLHEAKRPAEAERVYRAALDTCGPDPVLLYNLGVLLDDLGRKPEALEAYRAALKVNPELADCHYNLALLCGELGRRQDAIRHMAQYRKLAKT